MSRIDFKKDLKQLYNPSAKQFSLVDVPELHYLMIDGAGDPGTSQAYQDAMGALYAVAYAVKFMSTLDLNRDYVVPPLEGLWWADDMEVFTTKYDRTAWRWTAMILTPDWITPAMVQQAVAKAEKSKNPPALPLLRLEGYHEGLSVQIMHIGPYAEEGPTLHRLHHEFMPENGYTFNGKHHEIYLSDPRRSAPEKLKTVLRQPVRQA